MTETTKICFTCRKNNGTTRFYPVQNLDTDNISFWEKLKFCVTDELIENGLMEMCLLCVKNLRISYTFRQTVLMAQEDLKKGALSQVDERLWAEVKSESDSDSFVKSEDSSDCKPEKKRRVKSDIQLSCDYCGTLFSKQWQLRKHMARVHYDVRKFVCTYCNKEFKQSNHLKEHITSHTGEKNYSCPICEKRFQRLSSQRRHLKSHDAPPGHKTKRTPFLCTICGKSFPYSNGVQRHMRIHLGIKKFECGTCNRKFTQSTHLQVHMRTHTGEKPYICDTCGEKFSLKACMLKHINNRHYESKTLVDKLPIFYLHKDFDQH